MTKWHRVYRGGDQDGTVCRVTLVVPGSMTELIITHQKEDPWKMICQVCSGTGRVEVVP